MIKRAKVGIAIALALLGFGCGLLAPSYAELMQACEADPSVQAAARRAGMPVEDFCAALLANELGSPEARPACDGGAAGACELP